VPAIPINAMTFLVIASCLGGWGYLFFKEMTYPKISQRVFAAVFFAGFAALTVMVLITAIGFIPDDWSANRLTWSGGLLYGYHLYMGNNGPSNGFFYPPLGAWFYIPAAFSGILLHSVIIALVAGWSMSMVCIFAPVVILLVLLQRARTASYFASLMTLFLAACLIFSVPQLRYVATMVHVDSPALLFLGISVILLLPIVRSDHFLPDWRVITSGCFLAAASCCKQSVWPILPVLVAICVHCHGVKEAGRFLLAVIITGALLIGTMLLVENGTEAYQMIWKWPTRQMVVTPASMVFQMLVTSLVPIFGILIILAIALRSGSLKLSESEKQSLIYLLLIALWMTPFAIITRMRIGADWNHLVIPSYFLLLGIVLLFPLMASRMIAVSDWKEYGMAGIIFAILLLFLMPFYSKNCGWYLWTHDSHEQALHAAAAKEGRVYFPWQTLSTLILEKKLYHIDDCLRYEEAAGWKRPDASIVRFLPEPPFKIAVRPFGSPSYLVQKEGLSEVAPLASLPGWKIYQRD